MITISLRDCPAGPGPRQRRRQPTAQWARRLAALAVLSLAGPAAGAPLVTAQYGKSARGTVDGFPFLLLRGSHAERGKAHGFLAAKEVIASVNGMASFLSTAGVLSWPQALSGLGKFAFPSRFESELAGMLEGIRAALPNPADRVVKALGRELELGDLKVLQAGELFELASCSQLSAWGPLTADGEVVIGRNWDYPPLFPAANSVVLAIQPAESGLRASLEPMFFGMVGAAMATVNQDGTYFSGNDGGLGEGGLVLSQPVPAALVGRMIVEEAKPGQQVQDAVAMVQNKVALALIFHVSFPMIPAPVNVPSAIEYDPRPAGYGVKVRGPEPSLPTALILTNHFLSSSVSPSADSQSRYSLIKTALATAAANKIKLGFVEVQKIMDAVSRGNTQYTAVVWPKQRRLMVAIPPQAGVSATKGTYRSIDWDPIFSLGGGGPDGSVARLDGRPAGDAGLRPADGSSTGSESHARADAGSAPDSGCGCEGPGRPHLSVGAAVLVLGALFLLALLRRGARRLH